MQEDRREIMYKSNKIQKRIVEDVKGGDRIQKIGEQGSGSEGERGGENGRERDTGFAMYGTGIFPQKKPCFFLTFLCPKLIFVWREFSRVFLYVFL